MRRKLFILGLFILLVALAGIGVLTFSSPWVAQTRGEVYIRHLLAGRESETQGMSAASLISLAMTNCPDGQLHKCASSNLLPQWGELREIRFATGSAQHNSELYHLFFAGSDRPVSVVLIYTDDRAIAGWWGFVFSEGEDADSDLLDGGLRVNQFGEV